MEDSTVSSVAPAPSLRALLTGLRGRHRLKLALTYMTPLAVDEGFIVAEPVVEYKLRQLSGGDVQRLEVCCAANPRTST